MSTRSATIIRQEQTRWKVGDDGRYRADGRELREVTRFYRHFDGYPDGHGLDMAYCFDGRDGSGRCWVQNMFGPLMTGDGLNGTPHESWGAPEIEFEPLGTEHGDIEFLYAVTQRGAEVTICVGNVSWDERYDDAMAREPMFDGTAAEYIARFGGQE